ncbi:hypothetical protein [Pedobacter caeni]|uniref:Uncharacterized protein n=1 Tax=Pedobacter caeni TaxID=288992 RepID=A0A1M4V0G5_9SPHI|nr:hypothetical protein [Pedobacter caeni]SHE62392.1 hypothetical protein SAMN04488522_101735 [Pedobacter caeni]
MKKISLLAGMLVLNMAIYAQTSIFPGRYNGSKPEIAQEIMILPDGRFLFSLSYGAMDKVMVGKWTEKDGKLSLKEEKAASEPFVIFGRHSNNATDKGKAFTFKGFAENTSVAVSFEDAFEANSFKLLHLRDQSTFSRSNELKVTDKPVHQFFLSKPVYGPSEEDNNVVYTFKPLPGWNDFVLYYSTEADSPPISLQAVLRNDSLFLSEGKGGEQYFAVKKELSKETDLRKFDRYFLDARIPDSLSLRDTDGNAHTYNLLKSKARFNSKLIIPEQEAHFQRDDDAGMDQEQGTVVVESPGVPPPKVPVVKPKPKTTPVKKKLQ